VTPTKRARTASTGVFTGRVAGRAQLAYNRRGYYRSVAKTNLMSAITEKVDGGADRVIRRALGFFVTALVEYLPDGRQRISHSRWHRKGLPPIEVASDGTAMRVRPATSPWLRLWAPQRLAWWIAVVFIVGSACFAAGSFASNWPGYWPAEFVNGSGINSVFFVGSLFFTAAAGLQLLEAINGDVADIVASTGTHRRHWRWLAWKPHNAGYSASFIQFVGTLLFNVNTADAMLSQLSRRQAELLIWAPDVLGSICFLVASYLALVEVSHRFWSLQPDQLSWWIVIINLLGSVAFMSAAAFSFILPSGGGAEWLWGANFFTLLGAICFFVASYLMIPELFGAGRAIEVRPGSVVAKPA
jgi:hypothetical protein